MAEQPVAEKTHYPTFRKLQKARDRGHLPQSQELTSVVTLLVLIAMVALLGPSLTKWFLVQIKHGMSCEHVVFASTESFLAFINGKTADLILVTLPVLAALFVGAVLAGVAISGLNFSPGAIELKFDQLNPVAGFGKLFNARSIVKLLASILKLLCVSLIVWFYLKSRLDVFATLRWAWSTQILAVIARIILGLLIRVGVVLLLIGKVRRRSKVESGDSRLRWHPGACCRKFPRPVWFLLIQRMSLLRCDMMPREWRRL